MPRSPAVPFSTELKHSVDLMDWEQLRLLKHHLMNSFFPCIIAVLCINVKESKSLGKLKLVLCCELLVSIESKLQTFHQHEYSDLCICAKMHP